MSAITKRHDVVMDDDDLLVVMNNEGVVKGVFMLNNKGELTDAVYNITAGGYVDMDEFSMVRREDGWVKVKGKILC